MATKAFGLMAILALMTIFRLSVSGVFGATLKTSLPMQQLDVDETKDQDSIAEDRKPNYRLNMSLSNIHYNLRIQPYLLESDGSKQFSFDGEVYINITMTKSQNTLTLHAKDLDIMTSEYWDKKKPNERLVLSDQQVDNVTDFLTFEDLDLKVGSEYVLHFKYRGMMSDDMHGFYRSSYTDSKNVTKWLGSTQFQTHHARRVFPCFDEPAYKAYFDLELVRHKSLRTVANTRLISSVAEGHWYVDKYKRTPRMSTYILAFTVSEFNERGNGEFGVVARPEFYDQTHYGFEVGPKILKKLDQYLGIKYYDMGVDKMHMAAIPDFAAGAMENWGLLTYRERALLYDEGTTTLSSKQSIASIIAHEQAHMWFGDYVTCKWWSYTWLNEGFARYFQYFATNMVETEFELDKQFVVEQVQSVMQMDATSNTNPMTNPDTNAPSELRRMFNSISYNKGASFVRMVKHVLGESRFKEALQRYLRKFAFQNTEPMDLFNEWEKDWPSDKFRLALAMPFFKSFTEQVGYPVVNFKVVNETKLILTQKRFLLRKDNNTDPNLRYVIPISFTTDVKTSFNETAPQLFVQDNVNEAEYKLKTKCNWIIGNIQQTGYYRVNYTEENWRRIGEYLNRSENIENIHVLNRAQIVDDLLNLARAGEIDYGLALQVLEYLKNETHYLPWTAAFNGFSYLVNRLGHNDTAFRNFSNYIRDLTNKAYVSLGFEERSTDKPLEIYNRANILNWMCKYGNRDCTSTAMSLFRRNLQIEPVPVNIRSVVYCVAMREGNVTDFEKLHQMLKTTTAATEITLLLTSLGCVKDRSLVERYFNMIMSDEVRKQDKESALQALFTQNSANVEVVFDLLVANLATATNALGESFLGQSTVASKLGTISSRFTEQRQLDKLLNFIESQKKGGLLKDSVSVLEDAAIVVRDNLNWDKEGLTAFNKYLAERSASRGLCASWTLLAGGLVATLFLRLKSFAAF